MELNKLLEQANEHVVKTNILVKDVENFENILNQAKEGKICVYNRSIGATHLDIVLDEKVMSVLKEIVTNTLTEGRDAKKKELQKLIGFVPVTFNPEFEQAVKEMEAQHGKGKVKEVVELLAGEPKPELTVKKVKELYHDKDMKLDDVAGELGVPRTTLYNFIVKNNLKKASKREQKVFKDTEVRAKKPR